VENLNYEGTFVHMHDGRAETLKLIHRVDELGRISERLISLDGAGREIVRNQDEVKCFLPDQRSVFVEKTEKKSPFLGNLPNYSERLGAYYFIVDCADCTAELESEAAAEPIGSERCGYCVGSNSRQQRLLSMDTLLLAIKPRDQFRYGYRLWLDRETALPLKTQLLDERGEIIEQIRFTSLSVKDEIPGSAMQTSLDASEYQWFYQTQTDAEPAQSGGRKNWSASSLPPGFELSDRPAPGRQDEGNAQADHQVYTDGLASISVFVETDADPGISPGLSRLGAANAFSLQAHGHVITAIGEVPAEAVEQIARSVQFQSEEPGR
jgi:sigma-E factor negative regulatory protein RseB